MDGSGANSVRKHETSHCKIAKVLGGYKHTVARLVDDGHGLSEGLQGDECPRDTGNIRVADAFDAFTSDYAYLKGLPLKKPLNLLRQRAGTYHDD